MARPESPGEDLDPYPYLDLRRARLCLDCEVIFQGVQCPACSSASFVPLTRWIRPIARETAPKPAAPVQEAAITRASKPKRLFKKSLYVGLGAYGMWKMLFEPPHPRKRKKPPAEKG